MFMGKTIRQRIGKGNTQAWLSSDYACTHNCDMENMATIYGNRLAVLMSNAGVSQYALSKLTGVPQPTIQRLLSGETQNPKMDTLKKLADCVGEELLTGTPSWAGEHPEPQPPTADFVPIRRVRIKPSAGITGYAVEYSEEDGKPIFFRADFLQSKGWKPDKLMALRVSGASMEPGLFDGDLVVIHAGMTTPNEGMVYVVNYEGETIIKRLRRDRGEWILSSDNADKRRYPDKRMDDEHAILIGQVVYKQSEVI